MQGSWWQQRPWRFAVDMNGDGVLTIADLGQWAHWLFFMPGDAFIAQFGPTGVGGFLELSQTSFGGVTSAWISGLAWLLVAWAIVWLRGFLLDVVDPTYRQQKREWRQAEKQARREAKARARSARGASPGIFRRAPKESRLQPAQRIEPTLGP